MLTESITSRVNVAIPKSFSGIGEDIVVSNTSGIYSPNSS